MTPTMAVAIKARSTFVMRHTPWAGNEATVDRPTDPACVIELWQPKGFNVARVALSRSGAGPSNRAPRRDEDSHRRTLPTPAPSSPSPRGADSLRHSGAHFRAGSDSLFRSAGRLDAECTSPPVGLWVIPLGEISNWSRRTGVDILCPPGGSAGFLPRGLRPSRPSVSRRCVTEPCPRSCKLSSVLSEVLRTSPTVLMPAALSTFLIRVANRT